MKPPYLFTEAGRREVADARSRRVHLEAKCKEKGKLSHSDHAALSRARAVTRWDLAQKIVMAVGIAIGVPATASITWLRSRDVIERQQDTKKILWLKGEWPHPTPTQLVFDSGYSENDKLRCQRAFDEACAIVFEDETLAVCRQADVEYWITPNLQQAIRAMNAALADVGLQDDNLLVVDQDSQTFATLMYGNDGQLERAKHIVIFSDTLIDNLPLLITAVDHEHRHIRLNLTHRGTPLPRIDGEVKAFREGNARLRTLAGELHQREGGNAIAQGLLTEAIPRYERFRKEWEAAQH